MLAEQLRTLRKVAGLTQHQLADKTGVPQFRISEYERGARAPSVETLQKLAKELGTITIEPE